MDYRNLGRAGENTATVPLEKLPGAEVDMLSIVLVGSNRTRLLPGETELYVDRVDGIFACQVGEKDAAVEAAGGEDGYSLHASPRYMARLVLVSHTRTSLTGRPCLRVSVQISLAMFSAVGLSSMR